MLSPILLFATSEKVLSSEPDRAGRPARRWLENNSICQMTQWTRSLAPCQPVFGSGLQLPGPSSAS